MADYDAKYWQSQIKISAKSLEDFHTSGKKVVAHYLDEASVSGTEEGLGAHKINMFWANIAILKAALYGNPPKPIAAREFQDPDDDIARVAAGMIERLLRTGPNGSGVDMHEAFQHAVEDRLIPGMGQVWLRYDVDVVDNVVQGVATQRIRDENVRCDYVFWQDFFYSPCRVWEECYWVARRVWMTEAAMKTRFPTHADKITLVIPKDGGSYAATANDEHSALKRGEIYEIWCKTTKKVHWIAKGFDEMLDEKDDPLEIPTFFPCPRPLCSNTTTTKFIPRADYTMVQDQYAQLNSINVRLGYLIEACKAVGVYDKTAEGVQSMLTRGVENKLVPVDNWAMFAEKGGIKGVVDWLPVEAIVTVIEKLREARVDCVQQIYELTGISDIMRGVTNARETYGAQQLKAQYSSSRLQLYQMQVGAFVASAMDIKASIISTHFQPQTIVDKSLVMLTPDREFAQPAVQLIKDSWHLMYRINVSSTQMSIPDYNAEKQMRQEFVTSMGQFVGQITPLLEKAPQAAPFMLKILQWSAASFSTSGGVETLFDNYVREVEKTLTAPQGPSPEQLKIQSEEKMAMGQAQVDAGMAKADAEAKAQLASIDANTRMAIANIDASTKQAIADKQIEADLKIAAMKQGDMFREASQAVHDKATELDTIARETALKNKEAEIQIQGVLDAAMLEVKNLAKEHEFKMKEGIAKAKAESEEPKDRKSVREGDIKAMQKMHEDLIKSVGQVMEGFKGLSGKKSISITLPDGKEAKAEVTTSKE